MVLDGHQITLDEIHWDGHKDVLLTLSTPEKATDKGS